MVNSSHPKFKKCNECNQRRKYLDEGHKICHVCYKVKTVFKSSGNQVIDDFIKYTLTNCDEMAGKMEFVPYDNFKDVEFIAKGGFSKIHKATWIDGPIYYWNEKKQEFSRLGKMTVALKELDNSKDIDPKELNELKIFYNYVINSEYLIHAKLGHINHINKYYGITQDPNTENFIIITRYYESGNLTHYITKDFINISWLDKLRRLCFIIFGLRNIHGADIIHKDYHSGNIFLAGSSAITGDLGISKSAIESSDDEDSDIYGIIPYVAPEIFHGQKYTKASDIYSFGMIMWELMTGRRPFWDHNHDIDLIIEICDGLRPPIIANAPEGYIELVQECWHFDPKRRPTTANVHEKIQIIWFNEIENIEKNPTEIIKSPEIGPITMNNPGAIYESRSLSTMIKSAESTRSLKSLNIISGPSSKRKFDNNLMEDNNKNDKSNKKMKLFKNGKDDYSTKELGFDIDSNINSSSKSSNNAGYISKEINFDI